MLGSVKALPSLKTNSSATGAQSYLFIHRRGEKTY